MLGALAYCAPIAILPVMMAAAMYGGWWLAGPFLLLWLADMLDSALGVDERNMDADRSSDASLFWYKLAVWMWVALYPITLIHALHQVFSAAHLALWEDALIVLALGSIARMALNAGHDMMHRRATWERRVGEMLMASVSFPQEITEHLYVHHAHVGTPMDSLSPPKGQSFWQYLPRSVARSYMDTWRVERERMQKRRLPTWHYSNPIWRYALETAAWYALAWWIGGAWGLVVFALICVIGIVQLRMADYIQHYGLQRIRLPGGRYERVRPRHSWSAAYRLSNWLYYNAQRHADHHLAAARLYPLLRHCGAEESPQLPGSYAQMGSLLMFPRRWFEKMDPLVDQWRARFYPQIDDWRPYDSPAYRSRPEAFEAIAEIHRVAPALAAWINRRPELLDGLTSREFADLQLPSGFGPDPEFEAFARRGLARVYWTRELDVAEMLERINDLPAQNVREAVETARDWSNDKAFQVGVHALRGNLSPLEAGAALANIAEASITAVLSTVDAFCAGRRAEGGVAAVLLGDAVAGDAPLGGELNVLFVYGDGPAEHHQALLSRCSRALCDLSRDNLLVAPLPRGGPGWINRGLEDFVAYFRTRASVGELLELIRARRVCFGGDAGIAGRFDAARRDILAGAAAREALIEELRAAPLGAAEPEWLAVEDCRGGFRDVERAAQLLQLTHAAEVPELLAVDAPSVFPAAAARGLLPAGAAERLAAAATLWGNLRGILRLTADGNGPAGAMSKEVEAVVARSCGVENLAALATAVRETAESAAASISVVR